MQSPGGPAIGLLSSWQTDMSVLARLREAGGTLPIIFETS